MRRKLRFELLESRWLMATNAFINLAGGAWGTAGNWSLGHVPLATEDVIADVPGNQTITVGTGSFTAKSIVSSEKIVLNGTRNLVGGSIDSTSPIEVRGGQLAQAVLTAQTNLVGTSTCGTLTSVTTNGNIDLSLEANAALRIYGGLNTNGIVRIGDTAGTTYGRLYFGDAGTAPGAIAGTAAIILGGSGVNYIENSSNLTGATGRLTFGSGITLRGKSGWIYSNYNNGSLLNQGTFSADVAGGAVTIGYGSGTFTNTGTINVLNGASLSPSTSLQLDSTAILNESAASTINIAGSLTSAATNSTVFRTQGTVVFSGGTASSPRLLEVMGQYQTTNASGFLVNNFSMGTLKLSNTTYVRLVDVADNVTGAAPEALYVNSVVIPVGSTIDLNGLRIVTRALQQGGTVLNGTITVIPDSGALTLGTPTPGAISVAGQLDKWSFYSWPGKQITVVVSPGGSGASAPVAPQVNWVSVELLDLADNVMATASSSSAGVVVTLSNVPVTAAGIYRIRIKAPAGNLASTGNYIVTAWDSTPNVRDMELNRTVSGAIATPYGQDQ